MPDSKTLVLSEKEVALKIQRIAWEIYEKHAKEKTVHLVGISNSGYWLAEQIMGILGDISDLELSLVEMTMDKKNPLKSEFKLSLPLSDMKGKCVVLIDDVLNSGKVLMYGSSHIITQPIKQLTTAVLIDRNHKRFPIKADVKGLSLSTTMQEHVEVEIKGKHAQVYLM